jgi:hypothetical protein
MRAARAAAFRGGQPELERGPVKVVLAARAR